MNRQQVHFVVDDLAAAVRFYSTMFATEPRVLMPDYAKWMLDEPRVNFAICLRGSAPSFWRHELPQETGAIQWLGSRGTV